MRAITEAAASCERTTARVEIDAGRRWIERLFEDCDRGAVPPLGECYGLDVIVDNSIDARQPIYLEGGDHATLIRMEGVQFARLTANAWRGHFSTHD